VDIHRVARQIGDLSCDDRLETKKPIAEYPPVGAFFQELLNVGVYKRSQGRITRQVTFGAMALIFAVGFYQMHNILKYRNLEGAWQVTQTLMDSGMAFWLPGILVLVCWWISYRLVNLPSFADFLIAVEAELNKVSWPTRTELVRSSIVVLISLLVLAFVIFGFDLVWQFIFKFTGLIGSK
jgi:preprotein translocase subunit SecE